MDLTLRRLMPAETGDLAQVLALLRAAFAGMEGRIDPPSSLHRMDLASLVAQAGTDEVWVIGRPVVACVTLIAKPGRMYLGKLAVDASARGRGLARRLVDHAASRAADLGLPVLELQTRVELTENHATFARLGFAETGRTAHEGYARPTSVTMRRAIAAPAPPAPAP